MNTTRSTRMRYIGADPRYIGQTALVRAPYHASTRVLAQFASEGFAWKSMSKRSFAAIQNP
ncbi:MAG TPA: hypothetical protein P5256_01570 [Beijerinckiaceae bacterium]|nr:hypothetical protein [Rhodoblastus sp.]MCC2106167.1 hypothetical protein [Hyphomicrobiales bacterium]HPG02452.1 hypothetical protein [Rhodoblastus sp.]HRY01785.1 hypothetical protein [Beijerinckiaceae bacterium]